MASQIFNTIEEELQALKKKRNAIILAHNYQVGPIQDVADFTGDSLGLSQKAKETDAEVILFGGVQFMAETASILCPNKTVLIPSLDAGCSLAGMVDPESVRRWKKEHPEGLVVTYVNSSAAVKAESDYCCTSSNAVQVVERLPKDREILFIPDFYLGSYVKNKTGRENITLWQGYCHVHVMFDKGQIRRLKKEHPGSEVLMHPECGCTTKSMECADQILSTEGMVRYAASSPVNTFVIATETGVIHKMKKDNPNKTFIAASEHAVCNYMKQNTMEKLVQSLEEMKHEIKVPAEIRERALVPIQRMLEIIPNGKS